MRYDTYVEVDPRIFRYTDLVDLVQETHLGFSPHTVSVTLDTDRDDDDVELRYKGAKTLEQMRFLPASVVDFESANRRTYLSWNRYGNLAVIGSENPPAEFTVATVSHDGFLAAASGDGDDRVWQGKTDIDAYKRRGRSVEGLPRVWDPVWEREIIDISGNPGRDSGTAGVGLWPAADLWYGPGCVEFMDFAAVRTVPVGEVTELSNGVLHVHLFDVDTPEPEVRRRQQVLRDHLHFDELAARADEINLALRKRGEPVEG